MERCFSRFPVMGIVLLVFMAAGEPATAEYYQWTDDKGNVHISNSPPPAGARGKSKTHDLTDSPASQKPAQGSVGVRPDPSAPAGRPKPAARDEPKPEPLLLPYSRVAVTMYSTTWCGVCTRARRYFNETGVSLTEIDVEKDPAPFREIQQKVGRKTGVPVIDVEGKVFIGFSKSAVSAEIEKKRVPKF
ncbi:MAG: glutaredoxin family protein [Nitrospirae bacterium]|nr:glutaredoxin family protein [Nitrospirota bacterium]